MQTLKACGQCQSHDQGVPAQGWTGATQSPPPGCAPALGPARGWSGSVHPHQVVLGHLGVLLRPVHMPANWQAVLSTVLCKHRQGRLHSDQLCADKHGFIQPHATEPPCDRQGTWNTRPQQLEEMQSIQTRSSVASFSNHFQKNPSK